MNITGINNNFSLYDTMLQKTGNADTNFSSDLEAVSEVMTPLQYYQNLCSEFPDITFRLKDKQTALESGGKMYLGYLNSMNQIGDNFGEAGQCSISIDISVIEKMMKDSNYEEKIKYIIGGTKGMYSQYEARAQSEGYSHVSVVIEEEAGKLSYGVQQSVMRYSTEEEVKEIWANESSAWTDDLFQKQVCYQIQNVQNELFDHYIKLGESREEKLNRLGIYIK